MIASRKLNLVFTSVMHVGHGHLGMLVVFT